MKRYHFRVLGTSEKRSKPSTGSDQRHACSRQRWACLSSSDARRSDCCCWSARKRDWESSQPASLSAQPRTSRRRRCHRRCHTHILAACLSPLMAWWLFSAMSTFQLPGGIALGLLDLSLDRRAVVVVLSAAVAATLLIAAVAGIFGFRADAADSLRSRAGSTPRVAQARCFEPRCSPPSGNCTHLGCWHGFIRS